MNSEINEQYLNKAYEDFSREHLCLMNKLKDSSVGEDQPKWKEADLNKQITLINTLMLNLVKLRNARKTSALRVNV
jgi:hypothetical protein